MNGQSLAGIRQIVAVFFWHRLDIEVFAVVGGTYKTHNVSSYDDWWIAIRVIGFLSWCLVDDAHAVSTQFTVHLDATLFEFGICTNDIGSICQYLRVPKHHTFGCGVALLIEQALLTVSDIQAVFVQPVDGEGVDDIVAPHNLERFLLWVHRTIVNVQSIVAQFVRFK